MGVTEADFPAHRGVRSLTPFQLALAVVAGLTLLRVAVLFISPLQLYPDEAQYWVWSREPALGYFSKPPMIAWLIWASTALGGDSEAWIRVSAPLLHAVSAVTLALIGRRLYGEWAGFWAAALYGLMPGVQLSSVVIATDAPMLLFISIALLAYVALLSAPKGPTRVALAGAVGLALGLGCLAKYAALYFLMGLIAHALIDAKARRCWGLPELAAGGVAFLVCLGPNLFWNLENGFHTVRHTVANAGRLQIGGGSAAEWDPRQAPGFFLSQFGVFGPLPFAILIGGGAALSAKRRLQREDQMLLCFVLPPLIIVLVEAVLSRANANWAGAAYSPASVLVAGWLVRWRAKRVLWAAMASQAAIAMVVVVAVSTPGAADALGLGNSIKRARGWREAADAVMGRLALERASGTVTALAVDDRFLFNALAYYARAPLTAPGAPPLRIWVREANPNNQAETTSPLTPAEGGRVLFAQAIESYHQETLADFASVEREEQLRIPLDRKRTRDIALFVASGFQPIPRH